MWRVFKAVLPSGTLKRARDLHMVQVQVGEKGYNDDDNDQDHDDDDTAAAAMMTMMTTTLPQAGHKVSYTREAAEDDVARTVEGLQLALREIGRLGLCLSSSYTYCERSTTRRVPDFELGVLRAIHHSTGPKGLGSAGRGEC
jgi:hypothetical protein